jgi:hypothetical protein
MEIARYSSGFFINSMIFCFGSKSLDKTEQMFYNEDVRQLKKD